MVRTSLCLRRARVRFREGAGRDARASLPRVQMRAMEELTDDQARQLSHDLETGYAEFIRFLTEKGAKNR